MLSNKKKTKDVGVIFQKSNDSTFEWHVSAAEELMEKFGYTGRKSHFEI